MSVDRNKNGVEMKMVFQQIRHLNLLNRHGSGWSSGGFRKERIGKKRSLERKYAFNSDINTVF